jgi:hypothetical protein
MSLVTNCWCWAYGIRQRQLPPLIVQLFIPKHGTSQSFSRNITSPCVPLMVARLGLHWDAASMRLHRLDNVCGAQYCRHDEYMSCATYIPVQSTTLSKRIGRHIPGAQRPFVTGRRNWSCHVRNKCTPSLRSHPVQGTSRLLGIHTDFF